MAKHKKFHGPGGKGGVIRQMSAFCHVYPYGTRSGMPQPGRIRKELSNALAAEQLTKSAKTAPSVTSTESGDKTQHDT